MNLKFIIIASLSLGPAAMSAQTEMTVNPAGSETEAWGTSRTERYDVAFRLNDYSLDGSALEEIRIPFTASDGISDCTIWISKELTLSDGSNAPDILEMPATPTDGYLSVSFSDRIPLDGEDCYIGFSFTVDELNEESKRPVTVSPTQAPGEMYVHTSRRYLKWGTQNLSFVPSMELTLSGDFHDNAVAVMSLPEMGSLIDNPASSVATIRNHGLNDVASIDYTLQTEGETVSRHIEYNPPLLTHYFANVELPIEVDTDLSAGGYPLTLTIDKVNGENNLAEGNDFNSALYVYPYLPERVPLMEEYTGTWCGWCPRGIVGMEKMSELYPGKFVYAAYHRDKDPMNTVEELATPYAGAPSGYLDRTVAVDPFNGTSPTNVATAQEGIGIAWNERREVLTTGEISADAAWADEKYETITVKSTAVFVRDYDSPRFKIGYLLIADGLKSDGADWEQSNYFSDNSQYADTELIEFVERPAHISDMIYDGVVVMSSSLTGVDGSLPETIAMTTPLDYSYSFDLNEAKNYMGKPLPINKERLSVISFIADTLTGEIVNCTQCVITDPATVEMLDSENLRVRMENGRIIVSGFYGYAKASLLSMSGSVICHEEGKDEIMMSVPDCHGVYILKINGKSKKLII